MSTEREVRTSDGAVLYVERRGRGAPWLLVHGFTTGPSDWHPVAERLVEGGCEVVLITTRGHGRSTPGDEGFGIERLSSDVIEVADALGIEKFSLAGHSLGATIAAATAGAHASRVERLGLVAGTLTHAQGYRHLGALLVGSTLGARLVANPVIGRTIIGTWFSRGAERSLVEEQRVLSASCPPTSRAGITRALRSVDVTAAASRIAAPTAVIHGSNDRAVPLAIAEAVAQTLPNATLRVIERAGHMVLLEQPEAVARELLNGTP